MTEQENLSNDAAPTGKLVNHLIELRQRLIFLIITISAVFLGLFYFNHAIFNYLTAPLIHYLPQGQSMISTSLTATFVAPIKLVFFLSVVVCMPIVFYQLWAFVAPGLYHTERRIVWPLLFFSSFLFYLGMSFAYFCVFPLLFNFFIQLAPANLQVMPDLTSFINLVLKLFFAFGLAFEVPIAIFLVVVSGLCSAASLASKRPYVIVGAFILGMLLTPPDVLSQVMLAIPLYFLFEIGLLAAKIFQKKQRASLFVSN